MYVCDPKDENEERRGVNEQGAAGYLNETRRRRELLDALNNTSFLTMNYNNKE